MAGEASTDEIKGINNRLIAALPAAELRILVPNLRSVSFSAGEELLPGGAAVSCLFVERGVVSLLCAPDGMLPVEVGVVSREGMLGLAAVLGAEIRLHSALALTSCEVWAIPSAQMRNLRPRLPALQESLLQYAAARLTQVMKRSACHLQHRLEHRLADWILTVTDRLGDPRITVTHRQLSQLLGATRPGVTLAVQDLEGLQAIRATRNLISVRSRSLLHQLSCGCMSHTGLSRSAGATRSPHVERPRPDPGTGQEAETSARLKPSLVSG